MWSGAWMLIFLKVPPKVMCSRGWELLLLSMQRTETSKPVAMIFKGWFTAWLHHVSFMDAWNPVYFLWRRNGKEKLSPVVSDSVQPHRRWPTRLPRPWGILQARTLEWVAISFSNAWKWKVKVKSLSHVRLLETPWTAAYQAPPSMGFSRQEYWSGVPLPSPKSSDISCYCRCCLVS